MLAGHFPCSGTGRWRRFISSVFTGFSLAVIFFLSVIRWIQNRPCLAIRATRQGDDHAYWESRTPGASRAGKEFKTQVMHTDDRRPLGTFETTISAVIGLQFYRLA